MQGGTVARLGVMPQWLLADADRWRLGSAARSRCRACRCRRRSELGAVGPWFWCDLVGPGSDLIVGSCLQGLGASARIPIAPSTPETGPLRREPPAPARTPFHPVTPAAAPAVYGSLIL